MKVHVAPCGARAVRQHERRPIALISHYLTRVEGRVAAALQLDALCGETTGSIGPSRGERMDFSQIVNS